ncbi:DEAD/DEAH box helicase [Sporomusa sphaeroides DSM 2875]|uniref:DEAD/DEAH box helicase n=1 Tax=Sporomusa sphaeroides TaxID=47679 RepID=UPI0020309F7B|nr:DEAD/DEAH box helicase [Sporomusa sphaeroides]MCM0758078.1 DEAD/DEAH box helicase [Sporomusa sphaeroides DSM 2875]
MFNLRGYQELLIDGARIEFQSGKKRVCLCSPCGSGKTVIMADMSSKARLLGNRTLFVVHRQELIEQSSETFKALGVTHGIIAAGYPMNLNEMIQIGSIQTVVRRTNKIYPPQVIIIDEGHHSTAATWRKLLEAYPDAYVVGLTATPARMGGQGLGDIFESLIIGPTVKELIEWGNLSPYRYYAPPVAADLTGLRVKYGDYAQSEVAMRMDKSEIIGDLIAQYQKLAPGARAVCYCASRAHSQHTADMFRQAGIPALHIDGETPDVARKSAISDFKNGTIKILCNVDLISEGFDVPAMEAVILARPTQSLTLFIQQAMRAMRLDKENPGKVAVIIDHVGNLYRHGLPDEDREWSLEGKKKKPSEKQEFPLKQCPKCYGAHRPAPICPYCMHVYVVEERTGPEQRAGELAEIIELEKKRKKEEVKRARDVVTLEQIAMARGYRPSWVTKMCELKRIPLGNQP